MEPAERADAARRGPATAARASRSSFAMDDNMHAEALEIMKLADRHARDGQVSIVELQTFLASTQHAEFCEWILRGRQHKLHEADHDHSQALDLGEIEELLREFMAEMAEQRRLHGRKLDKITRTVTRVCNAVQRAANSDTSVKDNWFRVFKQIDRDGSGNLSFSEIRQLVRKSLKLPPHKVSERDLDTLWSVLDADNSGTIAVNEWVGFMRRAAAGKLGVLITSLAPQLLGTHSAGAPHAPVGDGSAPPTPGGYMRTIDPDAVPSSPMAYSRMWAHDVREGKEVRIGGYCSLNRTMAPRMGQMPQNLDADEQLLRRQKADLAARVEQRKRWDDTSCLGDGGFHCPRYALTKAELWRAIDIEEHRRREREQHVMKLQNKAESLLANRGGAAASHASLTATGAAGARASRTSRDDLRARAESSGSHGAGMPGRSKSTPTLGARPASAPAARSTLWLNPIDHSEHWSDRLALVPTKSAFTRQQLFVEERKLKFKQKKVLFAMVGRE